MPTLRILVIHCAYQLRGGEDSVVESEVALLQQHGHDVKLWLKHNSDIDHMPRWQVALDTIWSRRSVQELKARVADWRPDVIHVHNTSLVMSPSVLWAAHELCIPVVQTLHNFRLSCLSATFLRDGRVCEDCLGHTPWEGIRHGCYRGSRVQSAVLASSIMVHRWRQTHPRTVQRFIALTAFARDKLVQAGLPGDRIRIKPNFVPKAPDTAASPRRGALYVGRLSVEKGINVLLEAVQKHQLPVEDLLVLGTGPFEAATRQALGVRYRGHQPLEEVLTCMHRASFLLLPSVCYEGFPRTVVEAFSRGLPVIASRLGSMAELIEHQRTGLLFTPGDSADLARTVKWALDNPDNMAAMGENARQVHQTHFTEDRNHDLLVSIYQEAIAEAKPHAPRNAGPQ
ncbi:glycosyltransferase family 1 protein [Aquabacterium lacunae]|uniref:Glycosyltransferase family 1 protein n=1 Tax=Aquabacterium lacunae TaxID=2528630 RepID=A0A4Q9GXR0_9BURK|nr:glycosyltransferase family 1 protein [Aquabacterium lacunae]